MPRLQTIGRPSIYSEELAEQICNRIASGQSVRQICELEQFPARSTVMQWLAEKEDFRTKCARARELQADYMDDLILEAANACNEENYQSTRVKISAYQWRASKLKPKVYGEKIQQEHSGELGIKVIAIQPGVETPKDRPALKPAFDEKLIEGE